ncbi:MAG: DsbA family protein [Proteobacteria bacterium]|nr:DsbA family protein [Pseudomonadota bacterium]MDA1354744.1 DsbA family protein [Pseudomonadota bacterium]
MPLSIRQIVLAAPLLLFLAAAILRPVAAKNLDARPGDMVFGQASAPVTMIEYYSLNCSHCAAFHKQVFPALKAKYIDSGQVRFVLRDFPLSWAAVEAAVLAQCAGPERYLAVQDALFANIRQWSAAEPSLLAIAEIVETAGVTRAELKQCVEEGVLEKQVIGSFEFAKEKLGVDATPTFFINGEKHVGGISLERLAEILAQSD